MFSEKFFFQNLENIKVKKSVFCLVFQDIALFKKHEFFQKIQDKLMLPYLSFKELYMNILKKKKAVGNLLLME